MSSIKQFLPAYLRFLISLFITGLLLFTLFRIVLLLVNHSLAEGNWNLIPISFWWGLRFDACVLSYILVLPFVFLSVGFYMKRLRNYFFKLAHYTILILFLLTFFISCADIPYFDHFFSRISSSALAWNDSPVFVLKMIFSEISYWIYFVLFILTAVIIVKIISKAKRTILDQPEDDQRKNYAGVIFISFFTAGLLFLGMRGRMEEKSPIVTGMAYFSDNSFANELGLNPVFTFMSSWIEDLSPANKRLELMKDEDALFIVKNSFKSNNTEDSPLARKISADGKEKKMNVVVVIMEGLSSFDMGKYGGPDTLTPNLDSLAKISLNFENIFTQGIHTFNGIFSTLFSYPALLRQHPMHRIPSHPYYSMPEVLKGNGYENLFFISHDGQFDNAEGFLMANGFDEVYSKEDYPEEKILSTLGVPDDYLFEFSIPKMNELAVKNKNFFCGFMTGSNHRPLIFPEWAKINFKSKNEEDKMIEYSDWSIGQFMKLASKQNWYTNTIFVFVADHGSSLGHTYDMPLSFHHTPLIIHIPGDTSKIKTLDCLGGQIDIFPTLMGLMNMSYINNTMGIDLLKEKRPFIYFTADDKIGCLDKEFYFIHRMNDIETLYRYEHLKMDNLMSQYKAKADSMKMCAYSMLQASQWIIEKEKFSKK